MPLLIEPDETQTLPTRGGRVVLPSSHRRFNHGSGDEPPKEGKGSGGGGRKKKPLFLTFADGNEQVAEHLASLFEAVRDQCAGLLFEVKTAEDDYGANTFADLFECAVQLIREGADLTEVEFYVDPKRLQQTYDKYCQLLSDVNKECDYHLTDEDGWNKKQGPRLEGALTQQDLTKIEFIEIFGGTSLASETLTKLWPCSLGSEPLGTITTPHRLDQALARGMYGAGFIQKIFEDPAAVDTDDVTDRTSRSEFIEGAISKIRFQNGQ